MKVVVIGGSGFIGRRFINLFNSKFDEVKSLNSKVAPLSDFQLLLDNTKGFDTLVHAAFDHSYKSNLLGIKNIIKVCKK